MKNTFSAFVTENLGFSIINAQKQNDDVNEAFKSALLRSLSNNKSATSLNQAYIDFLNANGYALSEINDNDFVEVSLTEQDIQKVWNDYKNIVIVDNNGEIVVAANENGFIINKPQRKQLGQMIKGLHKWINCRVYAFKKLGNKKKPAGAKYEKFDEKMFFSDVLDTRLKQAAVLKIIKDVQSAIGDVNFEDFSDSNAAALQDTLNKSGFLSNAFPQRHFSISIVHQSSDSIKLFLTNRNDADNWSFNDKDVIIKKSENADSTFAANIAAAIIYKVGAIIDGIKFDTYNDVLRYFKKDSSIRKLILRKDAVVKINSPAFGDNGLKDSYTDVQNLVDALKSSLFQAQMSRLTGQVVLAYNEAKKDTVYVFTSAKTYPAISALRFAKNTIAVKGSIEYKSTESRWSGSKYDFTAIPSNLVNDKLYLVTFFSKQNGTIEVTTSTFNEFYKSTKSSSLGEMTDILVNSDFEKQKAEAVKYIADFFVNLESTLKQKFPAAALKNVSNSKELSGFESAFRYTVENFGLDGYKEFNTVIGRKRD